MSQSIASTTTAEIGKTLRLNWSLIRRIVLSSSILTLIFSSLFYQQLISQFETTRLNTKSQDAHLLSIFNELSNQQLTQIRSLITSLDSVNQAVKFNDPGRLAEHFNKYWPTLNQTHQVSYIGFYDLTTKPIAAWPENTPPLTAQKASEWINVVEKTSSDLTTAYCEQTCDRYLVTPVVFKKLKIGYLILALPITKTLNSNDPESNRISGILTPAKNPETSTDILVFKWGHSINGNSLSQKYSKVLEEFTRIYPVINTNNPVYKLTLNSRHYELGFHSLQLSDHSLLVILDDISDNLTALQFNTFQFALICFIALLTLQPLIIFRLKPIFSEYNPTATEKLKDVPEPEVANIAVDSIAQQIEAMALAPSVLPPEKNSLPNTEKEQVWNDKFDSLKLYTDDINFELARQMISLSRERDMISKILDNSQAIIMQLDHNGTIMNMNSCGEKIIGYSADEVNGKKFIDLYPENSTIMDKELESLSSIFAGKTQEYQHETQLRRKDGKECIILWLHTNLKQGDGPRSITLSSGLDITQRKKLEKNMSWLLNHDNLTSLFNRRRFEKELENALIWSKQKQKDGVLITIDLENFKDINDSCGHKVGDIILRKVASTLKELTRQVETSVHCVTARLGGDEFAIILRQVVENRAIQLSRKIINALNNISHFQHQVSFQLTSSIGIATFSVADFNSTELLSNANYARNQAKVDGRNQYHIFKTEHSHLEQTHHRMIWRKRIESALENEQFILYFQPILNIQENTISHYETLIRMIDENGELVSPGLFIHIAEQFGLIQQIDSYIIAAAIARQGELIQQGHDITLTINLSAKAFDDPGLFNKINQAIQLNNANPEHLVFEITETGAVSNISTAEEMMSKIQALGCQFALDDFGIGFSSFHYLRKLPVEYVKIDGSFVNDLANNSDNKILVQALSEVAIGFNKLTVAEFVDSRQTLEILKKAKVNFAQGFYVGKPSEQIPVKMPEFYYPAIDTKSNRVH